MNVITVVRRFAGSPEAAAGELGLRWSGAEGAGPCPACGGKDRAWVHEYRHGGNRITINCRKCENRNDLRAAVDRRLGPEPPDPTWVRGAAFAGRNRKPHGAPSPARNAPPRAAPRLPDAKVGRARRLWGAGEVPEGTPAQRYLVERRAWPPEGPEFPLLPPSVPWIPARRWPQEDEIPALPHGAAGVIAFAFEAPGGGLRAVSVDALAGDGSRLSDRWRRTIGTKAGARFAARAAAGGVAVIVEGEVSALATSLLLRDDPEVRAVLASGGTPGFEALALAEARRRRQRLRLLSDDDRAGRIVAGKAAFTVLAAGFPLPR